MKRLHDMTDEEQRAISREILVALRPIAPEDGRFPSAVLGLDLLVEGARLTLHDGVAPLPDPGDPAVREPDASTRRK